MSPERHPKAPTALRGVWAVHIDYHRPAAPEKQDYLLTGDARWIDVSMNCPGRDVEEISRANGDGILATGAALEASLSRDHVAVDIIVPMVMPTRDYARINPAFVIPH
jgi:hypothetical protein